MTTKLSPPVRQALTEAQKLSAQRGFDSVTISALLAGICSTDDPIARLLESRGITAASLTPGNATAACREVISRIESQLLPGLSEAPAAVRAKAYDALTNLSFLGGYLGSLAKLQPALQALEELLREPLPARSASPSPSPAPQAAPPHTPAPVPAPGPSDLSPPPPAH